MRPLDGCRVLDLGIITAGGATSALLADLGADVIKLESPSYRDPFRVWTSPPEDDPSAPHPFFRLTNRGKRGISLDLKQAEGRSAFLRLVRGSDVVVENFRRGVLQKLQIDYPALRDANPNVILASISSQGATGPDAGYVSFGSTLEAVGGLASLTGYVGGPPVVSGRELNLPDQVVAIFAASMVMTAWLHRRNGGGGAHLDLSQRELTSFLVGEAFVVQASGIAAAPAGNAEPSYAVQECLRAGDGSWVALSVTPQQLGVLDALVGKGARHVDRLTSLRSFCSERSGPACVEALTASGIAAAPVLDSRGMLELRGRLWRDALVQSEEHGLLKGFPFQCDHDPLDTRGDAPAVGADTAEVLAEVGGYAPEEIAGLVAAGAVELAANCESR